MELRERSRRLMHPYRTHRCSELRGTIAGQIVRLAGRVEHVRDLGGMIFLGLTDESGATQLVVREPPLMAKARELRPGSVIRADGVLVARRKLADADDAASVEVVVSDVLTFGLERHVEGGEREALVRAAEAAVRRRLAQRDFADATDHSLAPLATTPRGGVRLFRLATSDVAEQASTRGARAARLLELHLAFATTAELRHEAEAACSAAVTVVLQSRSIDVEDAASRRPRFDVSWPLPAHPRLGGSDLPLVATSETSVIAGGIKTESLIVWCADRVVGLGGVRSRSGDSPVVIADPLLAAVAADLVGTADLLPGTAWFLLDLDRLIDALPPQARNAGGESEGVMTDDTAGIDVASLLRAAGDRLRAPAPEATWQTRAARRLDLSDSETSAAMATSRRRGTPGSERRPLAGYGPLLDDFAMDEHVSSRLLDLFPDAAARAAQLPPGELFSWLWSLLGSESVRDMLRDDNTYRVLLSAAKARVLTEPRQLGYVDETSVSRLGRLMTSGPEQLLPVLRHAWANMPAAFSALLAGLDDVAGRAESALADFVAELGATGLLALADRWLCAPGLLEASATALLRGVPLESIEAGIRGAGPVVFANVPFSPVEIVATAVAEATSEEAALLLRGAPLEPLAAAIVHHLYRPVSLTFDAALSAVDASNDLCGHVADSGLRPGGRHWDATSGCYRVDGLGTGLGPLALHLSKNAPSVLAKGTVGICTSVDIELYRRPDHHHLNVVSSTTGLAVGNVQLHVLTDAGARILLVRAVNVVSGILADTSAHVLVDAVLTTCVELAAGSDIDEVHLGEGMSIWHLDSSRQEVRAVLQSIRENCALVQLESPFRLYRFGHSDVELSRTYRLWSRSAGSSLSRALRVAV